MTDNYAKLAKDNLDKLYANLPSKLAEYLPASQDGNNFSFQAFGKACTLAPDSISMEDGDHSSILDILISLYALNACPDMLINEPFKSFKELPDCMPYVGAFTTHTELILVPKASQIKAGMDTIKQHLNGHDAPAGTAGDFSFVVTPLPKISLCYIFYEADEDFGASVTCLYSNNAHLFLPIDGLADVGEYTSKTILDLIS